MALIEVGSRLSGTDAESAYSSIPRVNCPIDCFAIYKHAADVTTTWVDHGFWGMLGLQQLRRQRPLWRNFQNLQSPSAEVKHFSAPA